jgi:hypothetical protein
MCEDDVTHGPRRWDVRFAVITGALLNDATPHIPAALVLHQVNSNPPILS